MTLVRCHGDHAVAAFTIAAVSNAVAENDKHTQQTQALNSFNHLARRGSAAVRARQIFEEKLTTSIAPSRHGVGSALVSRRLHRPWPSWRVSGVQRRRFFCRARAVAP